MTVNLAFEGELHDQARRLAYLRSESVTQALRTLIGATLPRAIEIEEERVREKRG